MRIFGLAYSNTIPASRLVQVERIDIGVQGHTNLKVEGDNFGGQL